MGHHKECPYCGLPLDEQPKTTTTPNRFQQHNAGTIFGIDSHFTFGKYKGRTVSSVLKDDPGYIAWANENVEWLSFTDGVTDEMSIRLEQERDLRELYLPHDGWGDAPF
jgi:hypothetical protein